MSKNCWIIVGTHVPDKSRAERKGLYLCQMNLESGALEEVNKVESNNPYFLEFRHDKKVLYTTHMQNEFQGTKDAALSAYRFDTENGELELINQQPAHGLAPCTLATNRAGTYLLNGNYLGANVVMYPLNEDGSIGEKSHSAQHSGGSGVNEQRQQNAFVHSIVLDSAEKFAVCGDLGMDKIIIYRINEADKSFEEHDRIEASAPGAGPRHFVFHPSGKSAYLLNELNGSVTEYTYDGEAGKLTEGKTLPTIPDDFEKTCYNADLRISPDGKFLYTTNREHNSISCYAIDPASGELDFRSRRQSLGHWPISIAMTSNGDFLVVANENSDGVVSFRRDQTSGELTATGSILDIANPVFVMIAE